MTVFRCCCRIEMEIWRRFFVCNRRFLCYDSIKNSIPSDSKEPDAKQINGIKFLIKPFYLCFCIFFCWVQQKLLKSDRNYATTSWTWRETPRRRLLMTATLVRSTWLPHLLSGTTKLQSTAQWQMMGLLGVRVDPLIEQIIFGHYLRLLDSKFD